jgi:pyridoxal 5'-phosphate synthase pdxS subunit
MWRVLKLWGGGVARPADAALMMQLGAEGVFVGSGIFKASEKPSEQAQLAAAIVKAVTHFQDPAMLAEVSRGISSLMPGRAASSLAPAEQLAARGN